MFFSNSYNYNFVKSEDEKKNLIKLEESGMKKIASVRGIRDDKKVLAFNDEDSNDPYLNDLNEKGRRDQELRELGRAQGFNKIGQEDQALLAGLIAESGLDEKTKERLFNRIRNMSTDSLSNEKEDEGKGFSYSSTKSLKKKSYLVSDEEYEKEGVKVKVGNTEFIFHKDEENFYEKFRDLKETIRDLMKEEKSVETGNFKDDVSLTIDDDEDENYNNDDFDDNLKGFEKIPKKLKNPKNPFYEMEKPKTNFKKERELKELNRNPFNLDLDED